MAISSTIKLNMDATSVKRGVANMKSQFKDFGKQAKLAIAGLGAATVVYFKKFAEEMNKIDQLAKRFGESGQSIQRLQFAAKQAGADTEALADATKDLYRNLAGAQQGSAAQVAALELLGINLEDIINLPIEDKFAALIEAYGKSTKGVNEFRAMQDLMGESVVRLMPLMVDGVEAFRQSLLDARPASDELRDAMVLLRKETNVVKEEAQLVFGKALVAAWGIAKRAAIGIGTAIAGIVEVVKTLVEQLRLAGQFWNALLKGDFKGVSEGVGGMGENIKGGGRRIGAIIGGGFEEAADTFKKSPTKTAEEQRAEKIEELENERQRALEGVLRGPEEKQAEMVRLLERIEAQLAETNRKEFAY